MRASLWRRRSHRFPTAEQANWSGVAAVKAFRPLMYHGPGHERSAPGLYNYAHQGQLSAALSHVDGDQAAVGAAYLRGRRFSIRARRRMKPSATATALGIVISGLIVIAIAGYLRWYSDD